MPYSLSALSASAGRAPRPSVSPVSVALQELHCPLGRRRDHRGEREPGDVERGRERLHLEVADRDHPVLGDDDERVRLRGVELDRELRADEREGVAGGAVLLGDRPERERILQVARHHLAAVEQRAEASQRRLQAGIGPRVPDCRMDGVPVRSERLEVERAGVVEDVEQHERVRERERGVARRERALVEERDRLAARKLEVAPRTPSARSAIWARSLWPIEPSVRISGRRSSFSAATRCDASSGRAPVVARASAFASRSAAARTTSCGDGSALRDPVLPHEQPVVAVGGDVEHLAAADAGRDPVRRGPVRDRAVDDGTGRGHRIERGRVDLDLRPTPRDGEHVVEREAGAGQDDV